VDPPPCRLALLRRLEAQASLRRPRLSETFWRAPATACFQSPLDGVDATHFGALKRWRPKGLKNPTVEQPRNARDPTRRLRMRPFRRRQHRR